MTPAATDKWRPSLGLVVLGVLTTVLALPLVGLSFFRVYENQLIREAEAELIAQGAVLTAVFAREIEEAPGGAKLLGAVARSPEDRTPANPFTPVEPSLDLTRDEILDRRPAAVEPGTAAAPLALAIGGRLQSVLQRAQAVTLAGFRITDAAGTVIAGRNEIGQSLAHLPEVAAALEGRNRAVLRQRISAHPPPPLYSISRGTSVRVFVAMPVLVGDRVAGVVYASRSPNNIVRQLYGEWRKVALTAAAILGATLAIAIVFSRAITRPIHALVARSAEIARGNRAVLARPGPLGTREVALLSCGLDRMARQLHERSDYVATFAAHVSHELKTPLSAIQGAAELMRDAQSDPAAGMSGPEQMRFLDNILADAARLTALLGRLREQARADNPDIRGTTTLMRVVAGLERAFPDLAIAVQGDLDRPFAMSPENAGIVFSHLADNAARHRAASLQLVAQVRGPHLEVIVRDDGEGISEQNWSRIFDAFFTTRREGGGTGMGLGIVRAMLQAHGGTIRALRSEQGAAFAIGIPLREA
ncbi:sensor histidine kinase [Methylobacterium planeticum]|uniref:histidine kinase n=1 Tax=Methylobacterium planeticum TaxID=2615211 RepID=A0A6N6MM30_9HYPH|nr:HAMP domain-containing sensor histidine kinase [Methylobacterium planeticum]KAB1072346.1 HAMP domain-containing histidine kinase [Methylobacterium planeticum]